MRCQAQEGKDARLQAALVIVKLLVHLEPVDVGRRVCLLHLPIQQSQSLNLGVCCEFLLDEVDLIHSLNNAVLLLKADEGEAKVARHIPLLHLPNFLIDGANPVE